MCLIVAIYYQQQDCWWSLVIRVCAIMCVCRGGKGWRCVCRGGTGVVMCEIAY